MHYIIFLFLLSSTVLGSGQPCTNIPAGLNTQRKGIDITKLDIYPLSSASGDNGFRHNAIDFTCNNNKTWQRYNIPDQIANVAYLSSGLAIETVDILKTREEITKNMASNVGLDVMDGLFSASGSYKKMEKTITNQDRFIEQVISSLTTMTSDLEPYWMLTLGRAAETFVRRYLKTSLDSSSIKKYNEFIKYFGTHIFDHIKFGGAIQLTLQTSKSYFEKHSDRHIAAQAEATFFGLFKLGGGHSSSTTLVKKEFSQATKNTVRYYGGNTNLLSKNFGIDKWQLTVKNQPWLLGGRLVPIYDLIQDDGKRNAMIAAVQIHIDKAYLTQLLRNLPKESTTVVTNFKSRINTLLKETLPSHSKVTSLGKEIEEQYVVPSWFTHNTELCYRWYPDGDGGQCGGGAARKLCAKPGDMTSYYRDDTDRRSGGCRMSWGIVSAHAPSWFRSVKFCYRWYPDGDGGQCGGGVARNLCAAVNSWTTYYRDDTDRRGGGCRMSWKLSLPSKSPEWLKKAKLCYFWYPDGDGGQCGGGAGRHLCANANTWTTVPSLNVRTSLNVRRPLMSATFQPGSSLNVRTSLNVRNFSTWIVP